MDKLNRTLEKSELASKRLIKARNDIQKMKSELFVLESALKTTDSSASVLEFAPNNEAVSRSVSRELFFFA